MENENETVTLANHFIHENKSWTSLHHYTVSCVHDSVAGTGVRSAGRKQRWSWKINQMDRFLYVTARMIGTFSALASDRRELFIILALNTTKVTLRLWAAFSEQILPWITCYQYMSIGRTGSRSPFRTILCTTIRCRNSASKHSCNKHL